MSSTNRGYDRHATDFYVTPPECVREFMTAWQNDVSLSLLKSAIYLEPCAGGDETHEMTYPKVIQEMYNPLHIKTMDIRDDSRASMKGDYLLSDMNNQRYDIIITNPPFYLAKEIIEKALNDVNEGGYVVMLLRLNFFGSKERKDFLQNHMPERVYVHSKRINFIDKATKDLFVASGVLTPEKAKKMGGDSIEYMHAVWKKGYTPKASLLKII